MNTTSAPRAKISVVAGAGHAGRMLLDVVSELAEVERNAAHELIARGAVWLDRHRTLQPEIVVSEGLALTIHFPPSGAYDALAVQAADIVWEDRWLLALNKRAGWYANLTPWDMHGTLPVALARYLEARDGAEPRLHLAHQLDRDTSGVLLVSKDPLINGQLQRQFVEGTIRKRYLAVAAGRIEPETLEARTGHGRGRYGLFRVYPLEDVGKALPFGAGRVRLMHTRFRVLKRRSEATLLEAELLTGRTHQIRLHLAHFGYPIIGDTRYGGPTHVAGATVSHHLLHAAHLALRHPVTRDELVIEAPLPASWGPIIEYFERKDAKTQRI